VTTLPQNHIIYIETQRETTTKATPTKRARIVCLRERNVPVKEIAKELDLSEETVRRTFNKYHKTHDFYYTPPCPGRPRKLSVRETRLAVRKIRMGVYPDASKLQRDLFPNVSVRTVRNVLIHEGLPGRRRRRRYFLTPAHVKKRLGWYSLHQNWTEKDWQSVIFSDEKKFNLFGSDGLQWCRRGVGEEFNAKNVRKEVKHGGGSIMVWGCITSQGYGELHLVEGIMDSVQFCKILDESLLGTLKTLGISKNHVIFQQDNDPKHKSKYTTSWLTRNRIKTLPWPPNSPDMNPMEHVWSQIDLRLRQRPHYPTNKEQLWQALVEAWAEMDDNYLFSLYSSMTQRVASLGLAKGSYTRY